MAHGPRGRALGGAEVAAAVAAARHARLLDPRSNAAYRAAGGRLRDLRETLERTLADERERGLDRERTVGSDPRRGARAARRARLTASVQVRRVRSICGCRGRGRYRRPMPSATQGSRDARSERSFPRADVWADADSQATLRTF